MPLRQGRSPSGSGSMSRLVFLPWFPTASRLTAASHRHAGPSLVSGSRRVGGPGFEPIVGHDEHTIGLDGELVLGDRPDLAIDPIEQQPEVREVTGEGPLDGSPGGG